MGTFARGRRTAATVAVLGCAGSMWAGPAAHADDGPAWTSLYASGPYAGAGWTRCPEPIRISVDTRQLRKSEVAKATAAMKIAVTRWNAAKTVRFAFGGEIPVRFDPATGVSTPVDNVARDRWIYVTLVKGQAAASGPDSQVVGLAGPLHIDPATNTIIDGSAAFQAQYVNKQKKSRVALLFAHELGHVFGLGHSKAKADIMYPVLHDQKELGAGDIEGIRAIVKSCPTAPGAASVGPAN